LTVDLPNPHKQDIGVGLLKEVLKQAEISREEWFSVA
jgi:predicted RNA binding protein YcfA (HicA-like mRNA interferase family)